MYTAAVPLTATVALHFYFTTLVGCVEVFSTISPSTNVFIPYTSTDDVVFTCTVAGDGGYSVLWQLSGLQIHTTNMNRYIIQPSEGNRVSNLTVTQEGRKYIGLDVISVECHVDKDDAFGLVLGKQIVYIVQFGPPGEVEDLKLSYNSEQKLILQWSRPLGIHPDVPITYLVLIINTSTTTITQMDMTNETHVLVDETREAVCQPHIFSVTAMNEAGNSSASTIMDSIPISLGIGPVASSQKVDQLLLLGASANITVSFQPATNCSERFPILNYTVSILGLEGSVVVDDPSPSDLLLSVTLTSDNIPLLSVDQRYSIIITACSSFACRSPAQPLVAVTTDTQTASAVFYSTAVSLNCSFAAGSSARGCLFVFHLTNENRSENATVYYASGDLVMFNTSCDLLTNTRGAYDEQVLVYDIEANGIIGTYPITASVTVEDEPDNFTCPLPGTVESEGIGAGAIAGIVLASAFAVIFGVLFIVMLIIHLRVRQKQRIHIETKGSSITWLDGLKLLFEEPQTSTEDVDADSEVKSENYPVAKLWRSSDNQSVSVEMLNCQEAKDWGTTWLGGRRRYARLYPEKNGNE